MPFFWLQPWVSFGGPTPCQFFAYDFTEADHLQANKTQFPRVLFSFWTSRKGEVSSFLQWAGAYKGPKRRNRWPRSGPAQSPRSGDGEEVNTDDKMRSSGSSGRTSGCPRTHQIFQPINTLYVKPVYLGFSMATKATRNQKNLDRWDKRPSEGKAPSLHHVQLTTGMCSTINRLHETVTWKVAKPEGKAKMT